MIPKQFSLQLSAAHPSTEPLVFRMERFLEKVLLLMLPPQGILRIQAEVIMLCFRAADGNHWQALSLGLQRKHHPYIIQNHPIEYGR